MRNGWTGGQYSLVRALLGLYLAVHFALLLPFAAEIFSQGGVFPVAASPLAPLFPSVFRIGDEPWVAGMLITLGVVASLLFAIGARDRIAALACWYVLACLLSRNPLISNPSLPYVGFVLVAHAFLPRKPYGSFDARGRVDPAGGWRFEPGVYFAIWVVLAVGYAYSGWTKLASPSWIDGTAVARVLENPLARPTPLRELLLGLPASVLKLMTWSALALELLFAPLVLVRALRPWAWLALVGVHVGLVALIDFADLSIAMVLVHLVAFDPAWVKPRAARGVEHVFYDGHCGVCHRFVRFLLAEDTLAQFRFAPLDGDAFARLVPGAERDSLPDSIVVRTEDGRLVVRWRAVIHIGERLGGLWRALATFARVVPTPVGDFAYDTVARVRRRILAAPEAACPLVGRSLAARFEP